MPGFTVRNSDGLWLDVTQVDHIVTYSPECDDIVRMSDPNNTNNVTDSLITERIGKK